MKQKEVLVCFFEADDVSELPDEEHALVRLSRGMTDHAYAPYSGFCVGAAVLLDNGEVVTGSNQENAAYPSGLCAERVAVFAAASMHPGIPMKMVAISAKCSVKGHDHPVAPCGACRQVLLEYEELQQKPIKILLSHETGTIHVIERVSDLLPLAFKGSDLNLKQP